MIDAYSDGAFKVVLISCFNNGNISEQQIGFVKDTLYRFNEAEIEQMAILPIEKAEMKCYRNQWIGATHRALRMS